jgi:hypothetical protein
MFINLYDKKIALLPLLLAVLLLCPLSRVSASVIWKETFSSDISLDDWEFFGWKQSFEGGGIVRFTEAFEPNFTIVDGVLVEPYTTDFSNVSNAFHNSTVAHGTWSFDLFFPLDVGGYTLVIMFIVSSSDGNYSAEPGMTEDEYLTKMTGYGLFIQGIGDQYPTYTDIRLIAYMACSGDEVGTSTKYSHSSCLTGYHHFDITRDLTGQFYVYHNLDYFSPIISYQNTFTTSSEKFGICAAFGSTWFDNITVSDTVDLTTTTISTLTTTTTTTTTTITTENETPGFSNSLLISTLIILVYLFHHRKKRSR